MENFDFKILLAAFITFGLFAGASIALISTEASGAGVVESMMGGASIANPRY